MKIVVFDPYKEKFFRDVVDHWTTQGHEVHYIMYYDPREVEWADLIWFETCDNNAHMATHTSDNPDFAGYDMHDMDLTGKQLVVRVIDIEAWYGHHNNIDWNLMTDVIFIAPHIRKLVERDIDFKACGVKVHNIPCGVNMDRFNPGDLSKKVKTSNIAMVCEKWPTKGMDYMFQVLAELPEEYSIHGLGIWNDRYAWEEFYQNDFMKRNKLRDRYVETEWVDNLVDWYKDKDYILSCSKKEAFGYNIAEGMAMGLKPIIHNFYGADKLWPADFRWDRISEAVELITQNHNQYTPQYYRDLLVELGFTLEHMIKRIEKEVLWKTRS